MSKRIYRAVRVQDLKLSSLLEAGRTHGRLVLGCDAAKEDWKAAFMSPSGEVLQIVGWKFLETPRLFEHLVSLRDAGVRLEIALEATGTYADPFIHRAVTLGLSPWMVSAKHSHDYAEIWDGVPSSHDSKSAAVIAKLHLAGHSRAYRAPSPLQRALRAKTTRVDWLQREYQADQGRLEGLLSRHWPEVVRELELDAASLHWLVAEYGAPQAIDADREAAKAGLRRVSRGMLKVSKIERIVASCASTLGLPPDASERELLRLLGRRLQEGRQALNRARAEVEKAAEDFPVVKALAPLLGTVTSAVLLVHLGDPREFPNARSLLKHAGLNLRERSSGRHKGRLKITKRGSATARRWLYLAAMRLCKTDPIVRAWVNAKAERRGDKPLKMKAIIALMRKLLSCLRFVAEGQRFDAAKLFDVERLKRLGHLPADFRAAPAA